MGAQGQYGGRSGWRGAVLALVLAAAVLWSSVLPIAAPRRAEAQTAEFAAACASPAAEVACFGAAALIMWYGYSYATGEPTPDEVINQLYDDFLDWWNGDGVGSAERAQIEFQYAAHPTYFDPTQDVIAQWASHILALNAAGWTTTTLAGQDAHVLFAPDTVSGTQLGALEWSGTIGTTCGTDGGGVFRLNLGQPESATTYTRRWAVEVRRVSDDVLLSSGASSANGTAHIAPVAGAVTSDVNLTDAAGECAYIGVPIRVLLFALDASGAALNGVGFAGVNAFYDTDESGADNFVEAAVSQLAFVPSEAAVELNPDDGERIYMPATGALVGSWPQSGARANGTTGEFIEGAEATGTGTGDLVEEEERSWWEGMFEGVRGAVRSGTSVLQEILAKVNELVTSITALPATIAALFNPAVAWADFVDTHFPAAQAEFAGVVPGCYVADLTDPELITGGGGNIAVITIGLPGNEVEITIPHNADVAAVTFPLSQVAVAAMGFLWMLSKVRDPLLEGRG